MDLYRWFNCAKFRTNNCWHWLATSATNKIWCGIGLLFGQLPQWLSDARLSGSCKRGWPVKMDNHCWLDLTRLIGEFNILATFAMATEWGFYAEFLKLCDVLPNSIVVWFTLQMWLIFHFPSQNPFHIILSQSIYLTVSPRLHLHQSCFLCFSRSKRKYFWWIKQVHCMPCPRGVMRQSTQVFSCMNQLRQWVSRHVGDTFSGTCLKTFILNNNIN